MENNRDLDTILSSIRIESLDEESIKQRLTTDFTEVLKAYKKGLISDEEFISIQVKYQTEIEKRILESKFDGMVKEAYRKEYFEELTAEMIAVSERYNLPLSLVRIDVDNFKSVNDNHSHAAGDKMIKIIGRAIKSGAVRKTDITGRVGGDEFGVLLLGNNEQQSIIVCEHIENNLQSILQQVKNDPNHELYFDTISNISQTVSMGIATYSRGISPDELDRRADQAAYFAKDRRKKEQVEGKSGSKIAFYDPQINTSVVHNPL